MLPDYDYGMQRSQRPADSEAERIEVAQNGLVDYLAAQIAAYNQIHRLKVDDKALKHALECISDIACDMYADYAPKSASEIIIEELAKATGNKAENLGIEQRVAMQNKEAAKSYGENFEKALNTITFTQIISEAHNG